MFQFHNSYKSLPPVFYSEILPTPVSSPRLVIFNKVLAGSLGLEQSGVSAADLASILSGNRLPVGAEPIAQAYAGHQFGHFNILGDGRAILLGEHLCSDGSRFDIQLKGPGQTPYSRRGDGRAALGPMLREYLISEAMHALGVPTTRSLAVVATGDHVYREQPLKGAVLTRVAASHIRVGTFEFAARCQDKSALKALADYTIARHYQAIEAGDSQSYLEFLRAVIERQAQLIAQWMLLGFIHGVMNTDNMSIAGESIDFGPCAFFDIYEPNTVYSSIDRRGRYAYEQQPAIALWNLTRFAETLLPLLSTDLDAAKTQAMAALEVFQSRYEHYWQQGMRAKLGLQVVVADDAKLIADFLNILHSNQADYSHSFRTLSNAQLPSTPLGEERSFRTWYSQWQERLRLESDGHLGAYRLMLSCNPAVIPRNYLVERALVAAEVEDNFADFEQLLAAVQSPFNESAEKHEAMLPPNAEQRRYTTYCGT